MSKSDGCERHSFKAPGRADRIGTLLADFFRLFPADISTEALFEDIRWPDGTVCTHCDMVTRVKDRKPMPLQCKDCRKFFSVRYGKVMQDSNLRSQTWLLALYALSTRLTGTSSLKLSRDLCVTQKRAWILAHRVRDAMCPADQLFSGPVEADETYVEGKEKNKRHYQRMEATDGPAGKAIVAGVREREMGRVTVRVVPDTVAVALVRMVMGHTEHGALVYTDEAKGYLPLKKRSYGYLSVKHSVSGFVCDQAHTNGMEPFWATLKRGYHGVYHSMDKGHLHLYVDELQTRHNERPKVTIDQVASLIRRMVGCRLSYKDLIADGPRAQRDRVAV